MDTSPWVPLSTWQKVTVQPSPTLQEGTELWWGNQIPCSPHPGPMTHKWSNLVSKILKVTLGSPSSWRGTGRAEGLPETLASLMVTAQQGFHLVPSWSPPLLGNNVVGEVSWEQ